jgi:hypothetical protein
MGPVRISGEAGSSLQISPVSVDRDPDMVHAEMTRERHDDPRKLTAMIARVSDLATHHAVCSVVVGVAAEEGDIFFPDYIDYLVSALRVEDQIFRMTRERVLLYLSDVDATRAAEVLVRIYGAFCEEFPSAQQPEFEQRMLEVRPGTSPLTVKDVLTAVFGSKESVH